MQTHMPWPARHLPQASMQAALVVLLAMCAYWLLVASTASATDYTWSGGGGFGSDAWSNGANWLGGIAPAPSSSIGNLTFPLLSGPSIAANDLSGLSINHLSINDTNEYALNGDGFMLGSGGLEVTETAPGGRENVKLYAPITLAGSQTWDISGRGITGQTTEESGTQEVEVPALLSGEAANLTVNLQNPDIGFTLGLTHPAPDDELGNVSIIGTGANQNDGFLLGANLNDTDGKTLTVEHIQFDTEMATGPLTGIDAGLFLGEKSSVGALTSIGSRLTMGGVLHLPNASFDSGSTLEAYLDNSGTQPGTDYNQLTATGPIDLGGASLELKASIEPVLQTGECPAPTPGEVYALVSTTSSLSGSFGNAPNGSTIMETECLTLGSHGEVVANNSYPFRIDYHTTGSPETVTATALGNVPVSIEPPTIAGTATADQTLSLAHGVWSNEPTSYADQWQRCDSTGNNCQSIAGASGQTYTLTAADVGSTIRVVETASNGEGTSSPASSAATAVVQATTTEPPSNNGGGGTPPTTNNPPVLPPVSCCDRPFMRSAAELKALLARQLVPATGVSTTALLKHGGLVLPFTAPEAGTATIQWFEVPAGAQLARKSKAKAVLVASGQASFTTGGPGTVKVRLTSAGRKLLKRGRRIRLEAKGVFVGSGGVIRAMAGFIV